MTAVMNILYNELRKKVIRGLESYKRMYDCDKHALKYSAAANNSKVKEAAMNTYNRSSAATRRFGKSVINDYVIIEDIRDRIHALDATVDVQELPNISFIDDKELIDFYPQAKLKYLEEERKKRAGMSEKTKPASSSAHSELRAKVLQQRNDYQTLVARYLEAEKNRAETSKKLAEIEEAMNGFPAKEQKGEKYLSLDKQRLQILSQMGKLNSASSKLSSDKFLKETSFTVSNGELLAHFGERFTIDDIKTQCEELGYQNDQMTRDQLRDATSTLEHLDVAHEEIETNLEKARSLFREVERQVRSTTGVQNEGELSRLIEQYGALQANLNEKEENYNFILSKIRVAYNVLQAHQAKLSESQRGLIKQQMQDLNDRTNFNQSAFVSAPQLNDSYEDTAQLCVEKLLQKREEIHRKLEINRETLEKLSKEVIDKSSYNNSANFNEMAFIQEEVATIDQENSELLANLATLTSTLIAQIEDVKKNCDRVSTEFYSYVDAIFKELMKRLPRKSKIPIRVKNAPKLSLSKILKQRLANSNSKRSPRNFKRKMHEAAKVLQEINSDPLMRNECLTHLDRFYNELKRSHKLRIGCTKIVSDIAKDRQNVDRVLRSQLLAILRQ